MQVYVLWQTSEYVADHFDLKLIGIYSSRSLAEAASERALQEPGFVGPADKLSISSFTVDRDIWPLGPFPGGPPRAL